MRHFNRTVFAIGSWLVLLFAIILVAWNWLCPAKIVHVHFGTRVALVASGNSRLCVFVGTFRAPVPRREWVRNSDGTVSQRETVEFRPPNVQVRSRATGSLGTPLTGVQAPVWSSSLGFSRLDVTFRATQVRMQIWQIPHWPFLLLGCGGVACQLLMLRRARALRNANRCIKCGYDLRATPDRCPECGTPSRGNTPVGHASKHTDA
jgi:hypothetical protein